jgi:hypothetical protein
VTAPTIDFSDVKPEPVGVPNWQPETSGTTGDAPLNGATGEGKTRPGIFAAKRGPGRPPKLAAPTKAKTDVPKLGPHMRQKITDFYILIGGLIMPMDPLAGETIIEQAPLCGKAVYDYAQENAAFRRVIQGFLTTSMAGALIFAHLPIILVLLRHSKNDGVKLGAGSMMVAMKMMSKEDAEKVFPEESEPVTENGERI